MIKVSDSAEYSNEEKISHLFAALEAQNKVNQANLKDHDRLQEIIKLQQEQLDHLQIGIDLAISSIGEIVKHTQFPD